MMVPFEMIVITNYATISKLKLIDTLVGLIIPFTSSIFYTYILRNFFLSIPDSLYYSARVDGASNWNYLWRVMVPIAKPALFTIALLNAILSWNAFFWPYLIVNSKLNRTLPLGLYAFITDGGVRYERLMAAATIVVIPIIILFLFARKNIVAGVARGGLKG
jgi:multiple sugar transport system permease protein